MQATKPYQAKENTRHNYFEVLYFSDHTSVAILTAGERPNLALDLVETFVSS